jgi:type II secretion system protein J
MKIKRTNQGAFTLIEMILAIGVSAMVLVAVTTVFFTALHLQERTQAAVDEAVPVDLALATMRRDLQCTVTPKPGGILSGDFKVGTITSPGINSPVAIEMFTATGALSDRAPWGEVQRVTYELKNPADSSLPGRDLIRSITRNLLTLATPDVEDQWMMSGVQSIQFLCFDGAQWLDAWDTTGMTSANTNLPVAVRVVIQMSGNNNGNVRPQPIQMLVPIDSQSRTNMTTTGS